MKIAASVVRLALLATLATAVRGGTVTYQPRAGTAEIIAQTDTGATFTSFSLERGSGYVPGQAYTFSKDWTAIGGGPDQHDPYIIGDPISVGTAWLFRALVTHTLWGATGGLYYDDVATNSVLLQEAIWALEDEYYVPEWIMDENGQFIPNPDLVPPPSNFYVQLTTGIFGGGRFAAYTGTQIEVFNAWDDTTNVRADRLSVLHAVPDEAATGALLGGAVLGLALLARRRPREGRVDGR